MVVPRNVRGPAGTVGASAPNDNNDSVVNVRRALFFSLLFGFGCARPPDLPGEDAAADVTTVDRALVDRRPPAVTSRYPVADLTVTLPFEGPEQPVDVEFTATPATVDVHLLVDTTASFDGEIRELQQTLSSTTIPALQQRIPSLTMGLSRFEDMPFAPFGLPTDRPYRLVTPQTTDLGAVASALFSLDDPLGAGGDAPESWFEALFQIATGRGLSLGRFGDIPTFSSSGFGGGSFGGVGFREGATRMIVLITDAPSHEAMDYAAVVPGAHSGAQAVQALRALEARVVGVASGAAARAALESVAVATGAVGAPSAGQCSTGLGGTPRPASAGVCPLVYDLNPDGTGLSRTISDGIGAALDAIAYRRMLGEAREDSARFVSTVEPVSAVAPGGASPPVLLDMLPAGAPDGRPDAFGTVRAGTRVRFRAVLRNRSVREGVFPQVFFLRIALVGDGVTQRETLVRVIVPEGPKFDAGTLDTGSVAMTPDAEARADGAPGPDVIVDLDATADGPPADAPAPVDPVDGTLGDDRAL